MKNFVSKQSGRPCDAETHPAAVAEMDRYCEAHPRGPAAVRRPRLFVFGANFIVLLGRSGGEGIVGIGDTVSSALRAFEQQYLNALRPPQNAGDTP